MKVNLPCIDSEGCRTVVAENGLTSSWLYPVIDSGGGAIAYSAYQDGSNNCWLIQYQDVNGDPLYEGTQPRYGTRLSWLDGKILASGYSPPSRRNRCGATDTIVKIDPATGSEVTLLRGYSPDAR